MTGSMADLKNLVPLDKRYHAYHPAFPAVERNSRRDQVVGEGKLVVKQAEEKSQECFHAGAQSSVGKKNKGLTCCEVKP